MYEVVKDRFRGVFSEEDQIRYEKAIELLEITKNIFNDLNSKYGDSITMKTESESDSYDVHLSDEIGDTVNGLNEAWYYIAGFVNDEINF